MTLAACSLSDENVAHMRSSLVLRRPCRLIVRIALATAVLLGLVRLVLLPHILE